jgi:hypothetical protein
MEALPMHHSLSLAIMLKKKKKEEKKTPAGFSFGSALRHFDEKN